MKKQIFTMLTGLLIGAALTGGSAAVAAGIVAERSTHRVFVDGREVQKYISDNCSKVGIKLFTSLSTRPGARPDEKEDQFTALRNRIAHPVDTKEHTSVSENDVNQLAALICCAIEDISL